jgi:N-acetylmuramic acid 6-phosphate etherase
VYIYGCGSTGRLAKQIESETWKQYWARVNAHHKDTALWQKVTDLLGSNISDKVIGELTGGDRALVNALEGFEDLQVIGKLQLE